MYIYIYIYIYMNNRGVTVHKIHGSFRYDTVVSRFSSFSIRGGGRGNCLLCKIFLEIFGNISVLRRANGYHTSTRLNMQTYDKISLYAESESKN